MSVHHDEAVGAAVAVAARTDVAAVAAAWVSALTTRDLAARSAFGSHVVLQHLPEHGFTPSTEFLPSTCGVCGLRETVPPPAPLTYHLRNTDITDATADLTAFAAREVPQPSDEDVARLHAMLDAIRALPPAAQLGDLHRALRGTLRSNKIERMFLLETLGFAGILCPADQRHYSDGFVTYDHANSTQPAQHSKREWSYPVRWWTGADGVDDDLVKRYFPSV
jgi:hypothetical protein